MKIIAFVAALACAVPVLAGEHPKEHPSAMEHPKTKEHPKGHEHPVGSKHWTKQMSKEFVTAVEAHVAKSGESFPIHDEKLKKDWKVSLIQVHKKAVAHLGESRFFACADFKTADGSKDKVDLDFYATKAASGWTIDKVLIHKVNGKARYTYNDKNEMVPAAE